MRAGTHERADERQDDDERLRSVSNLVVQNIPETSTTTGQDDDGLDFKLEAENCRTQRSTGTGYSHHDTLLPSCGACDLPKWARVEARAGQEGGTGIQPELTRRREVMARE